MNSKNYEFTTECMCICDNHLFFVPRECPVLCRWDFDSDKYEVISQVPDEMGSVDRLFNGMCVFKGKIYLAPYNARKIWIYEMEKNSWLCISVNGVCSEEQTGKFVGCCGYGDYVFFFGYECKRVVRVNINDKNLETILINGGEADGSFWEQSGCIIDSVLYVPNLKNRGICEIDLEKGSGNYKELLNKDCGLCGVSIQRNYMYAMPYSGNELFRIEMGKGVTAKSEIVLLPEDYKGDKNIFNGIVCSDDVVLLFSPYGKSLTMRNKEGMSIEDFGFVRFALHDEQKGFLVSRKGIIELYDNKMNRIKTLHTSMCQDDYVRFIGKNGLQNGIYHETSYFGLQELLSVMSME